MYMNAQRSLSRLRLSPEPRPTAGLQSLTPLRMRKTNRFDVQDIDGATPRSLFQDKRQQLESRLRRAIAEGRSAYRLRNEGLLAQLQLHSSVVRTVKHRYLPQANPHRPIKFLYKNDVSPKVGQL